MQFKCTTFDEAVRKISDIVVDSEEIPVLHSLYFWFNTESHRTQTSAASGLHGISFNFPWFLRLAAGAAVRVTIAWATSRVGAEGNSTKTEGRQKKTEEAQADAEPPERLSAEVVNWFWQGSDRN